MSKLSTIRKQIAALEAQAARIAAAEMHSAIGKVKSLMSDFGLTIEHLTQSMTGKAASRKSTAVPKKAAAKKAASPAKYADPKTGKTWSGFGRAPNWIASARNRDAFLVNKDPASTAAAAPGVRKMKTASGKTVKASVASPKATATTLGKKAVSATKKVTASAKKAAGAVKKSAPKKRVASKKSAMKKSPARKSSATSLAPSTASPAGHE